ncbi:hypothetical protein E3P77_00871 [Wallemia ichthyophaga]|nr:hypothetical protein E3P97_01225 [Wallemia ichthyophaga]TIB34230.1 hypothetical protein E3P85_00974 [Wallemia ichthyophaga]TIB48565.1 hypothetical protein E3P82_01223 [Wallemia ichthyophaga]TIB52548.1 hypothetical protein E3P81_01224 [Wallemia ichthyophaga]TIB55320.1 hypothetical protein E3P80_01224 [Wallemia ichthyophaga]
MTTLITTSFIGKGRKDDVDDGADGGNKARPVPQKQQTDSKKGGNDDAKMRKNSKHDNKDYKTQGSKKRD